MLRVDSSPASPRAGSGFALVRRANRSQIDLRLPAIAPAYHLRRPSLLNQADFHRTVRRSSNLNSKPNLRRIARARLRNQLRSPLFPRISVFRQALPIRWRLLPPNPFPNPAIQTSSAICRISIRSSPRSRANPPIPSRSPPTLALHRSTDIACVPPRRYILLADCGGDVA